MLRHKPKGNKQEPETHKEIASAKESKEHVGRVSDRIGHRKEANRFTEQVGRTSDRIRETKKADTASIRLSTAAVVATMTLIPHIARSQVDFTSQPLPLALQKGVQESHVQYQRYKKEQKAGESAKKEERIVEEKANIAASYHSPNQATGISVDKAPKTMDVSGIVMIKEAEGDIYIGLSKGLVNTNKYDGKGRYTGDMLYKNAYSIELNTFLHIVDTRGAQELWLQDILMHATETPTQKNRIAIQSEIFKIDKYVNSEYVSGVHGKGKMEMHDMTYIYTQNLKQSSSPKINIALDIKVSKEKNAVAIGFGYAPLLKNGKPNWKEEVMFDKVTYKAEGLKSADIEFSKYKDTGLTISGFSNGLCFYAKKLDGRFSLYETEDGKRVPLHMTDTTDYATMERAMNVYSRQIYANEVSITAGKPKASAKIK